MTESGIVENAPYFFALARGLIGQRVKPRDAFVTVVAVVDFGRAVPTKIRDCSATSWLCVGLPAWGIGCYPSDLELDQQTVGVSGTPAFMTRLANDGRLGTNSLGQHLEEGADAGLLECKRGRKLHQYDPESRSQSCDLVRKAIDFFGVVPAECALMRQRARELDRERKPIWRLGSPARVSFATMMTVERGVYFSDRETRGIPIKMGSGKRKDRLIALRQPPAGGANANNALQPLQGRARGSSLPEVV